MFLEKGYHPTLPGDLRLAKDDWTVPDLSEEEVQLLVVERVKYLTTTFEEVKKNAYSRVDAHRQNLISATGRRNRKKAPGYQTGDIVSWRNPKHSKGPNQLQRVWQGPYVVTEVLDHGCFMLFSPRDKRALEGAFSGKDLKHHYMQRAKEGIWTKDLRRPEQELDS
ncbi:hypothetical protein BGX27_011410 [Mortierella sp. AM989]|nr:hypothetical protein BGX27_011410 [Mortierella sp. AM989]